MKSVNGITKLVAAATALSVTFGLVWSMANLRQPGAAELRIQLAKPAQPSVEVFDVVDGKIVRPKPHVVARGGGAPS
jgi:hypothetical protein